MKRACAHWSIVVADDHGPEWAPSVENGEPPSPVQYRRLGDKGTLLQKALHRAARLSSPLQTLVTAREQYRNLWEPSLWYVKPTQRFVCDHRWSTWLTTAAALLRVADESPSAIVAVLPARCFVTHEEILTAALERALVALPLVSEGVVTLGMVDLEAGVDEDYLVPANHVRAALVPLLGVARRPTAWVARHLREHGALVASEIMIGYVSALTAHISRHWPGMSAKLLRLGAAAAAADAETAIPSALQRGMPISMLSRLRWYPPSLPQRALRVPHCGWSGLRSAQAVARISAFASRSVSVPARAWSGDTALAAP
jgi:mannose-1-phosphate guanylyltransferase